MRGFGAKPGRKCFGSMVLCGVVSQLVAVVASHFCGMFRLSSEAPAYPTQELSRLARRTSEAVHSVVCLAKSAGSAPGVCWLRVDRPPTHLGGMPEPFLFVRRPAGGCEENGTWSSQAGSEEAPHAGSHSPSQEISDWIAGQQPGGCVDEFAATSQAEAE